MDGGSVVYLMPCCVHVQLWVQALLLTSAVVLVVAGADLGCRQWRSCGGGGLVVSAVALVVARADLGWSGESRFLIGQEARKGGK